MSTLKVNNIESFTASDPLTITDANGLQVNSSITSSGDISASGAITALSFTGNLIGTSTIETSGLISSSAGVSASALTVTAGGFTRAIIDSKGLISSSAGVSASNITAAGNLTAGTITVNSNLTALNDIIVTGLVSSSGPESGVSASALTVEGDLNVNGSLNISLDTQNTSNDLATDAEYSVNGTKVEVRAITAAQIDDGTFATFKLLNTSIGVNDIVVGGFNGSHSNTNISSSILTATVIASKTASVFIHNETGAAIAADTPFTASFIVL